MIYKLLVNQTKVFEGGIINLIREMCSHCITGDKVEIYRLARTSWYLEDGGIYPFGIAEMPQDKIRLL